MQSIISKSRKMIFYILCSLYIIYIIYIYNIHHLHYL